MRHLRSILYALVLAPTVWVLCGVGFTRDLTGRARDAGTVETASAILLLVLAGAAYAILIFSPISPLGPALFGLLFLGISLWAVIAPDSYAGGWPAGITKEGFDLSRPGYALAALLAIPMLCTALSVRRWRGYEPPQLPLIGTLGRARGAAVAPGVPMAAEQTAVLTTDDPTEVINLPAPESAAESAETALGTELPGETVAKEPSAGPEDEPTEANTREIETATADLGGARAAGPDGTTQVIFRGGPPDQDARETGAQTRAIDLAGTRGQPIPGDQTQVLPGAGRTAPADDRTQMLPRPGTVEAPGDHTQVLSFPAPRPDVPRKTPGERTTDKQEPATRASSIVSSEQPDPAADPTTRLGSLRPAGEGAGEDTTADVGDNRRSKGMLDLERPADETADDPRGPVAPRGRPSDDEPTTRL